MVNVFDEMSPSAGRSARRGTTRACHGQVGRTDSVLSGVTPRRKGCSSVNALHVHLSSLMDDVRQCLLRLRQNRYCHIGVTFGRVGPLQTAVPSSAPAGSLDQRGHRICGDVHSCRDGGRHPRGHPRGVHAEWGCCIIVVERRLQTFFGPFST